MRRNTKRIAVFLAVLWLSTLGCWPDANPTGRPAQWAQPIEMKGVPNLHKLSETLYRSGQPTAEGMRNLKVLGVKTIVNLRSFHSDRDEIGDTGLAYEHIYMKTWHPEEGDAARFLQIVTDPKRGPVLFHCQYGADRTGTMCALYRVAAQGWTKDEAIKEMTDGGYGFHGIWQNLIDWLKAVDVERIKERAGIAKKTQQPDVAGPENRHEQAPSETPEKSKTD